MTLKRIDPWSVLKLSLVVNIAAAAILLVTGVVVWSVIRRLQLIERICEQAQSLLGFTSCTVNGFEIMRTGLLLAGLLVVVATGVMVFATFLYNLIADLTGGIEVSMLDQSSQARPASGGVQVAPELRTTGSPAQVDRTRASRAPVGAGAATAGGGPVMAPPNATIASAAARPNTSVPLLDEGDGSAPVAEPEPRQGVRERAAAASAMLLGAADRTGSALSEVGRRATTALTDATEGEASARAARAEASRQSLDDLRVEPGRSGGSAGSASPPPGGSGRSGGPGDGVGSGNSSSGRPARSGGSGSDGDSRGRDDQSGRTGPRVGSEAASAPARSSRAPRGSTDGDRASRRETDDRGTGSPRSPAASRTGSDRPDADAQSPQEAAAARMRARAKASPPPRDSDGRFVSPEEIADRKDGNRRTDGDGDGKDREDRGASAGNLFGNHPRGSDSRTGGGASGR